MTNWAPVSKMYDPLKAGSIDGTDTDPHDRAVIRAMRAKYKPNISVDGNPEKTIFISGLDRQTDEDTLWTAFRQYGKIKKCRLVRDIVTGFSKGYGFVEYEERRDAVIARRRGYRLRIDEVEVFVDYECERVMTGWVPRRFGGGYGGNKKAGQLRFGGRERPFFKPIFIPGAIKLEKKEEEEEEEDQMPQGDRFDRSRAPYDRNAHRGGRRDSRRSRDDYNRFDRRDQPSRGRSGSRERIRRQDRSRSRDRTDSRRDRRRREISEGHEEGQGNFGMSDSREGRQKSMDSWGHGRERSPARDQSLQRGQPDPVQNVEGRSHGDTVNLVNVQQESRSIDILNSDDEEGVIRCEESMVERRAHQPESSAGEYLASGRDTQAGGSLEQPAGIDSVRAIKVEPIGRGYGDEFVGVKIKVEPGITDTEKEDGECDDEPIVSFVENIVVKTEPV